MITPRPCRSLPTLRFIYFRSYHSNHWPTMSDEHKKPATPRSQQKKEKGPPLTHFLCLPLINSVSLPQLETSLAAFKASIPRQSQHDGTNPSRGQPLIPDGALRPVGTLHLTLGVMSLPTKDRLDEAIEFFQSLDLISMAREAEKAARVRGKKEKHASLEQQSEVEGVVGFGEESSCHEKAREMNPTLSPFSISLESLYALPRARAATVLHAVPVDSTSRLYPFCEMLRDKFLEAGFLQGEHKKEKDLKQESGSHQHIKEQNHEKSTNFPLPSEIKATVDERGLLEGMPVDIAEKAARKSDKAIRTRRLSKASKQRVRPLLLHATVANTIYVRGRGRGGGGAQKGKNRRNNQYTFDARDLLAHYRDYYVGSDRTTPRSTLVTTARDGREEGQTDAEDLSGNENSDSAREKGASLNESPPDKKRRMTKGDMLSNDTPRYPFVWAKDFPLEEVCICEMGAKKLDPNGDEGGMNARLREKYMAVVERSLDFRLSSQHT